MCLLYYHLNTRDRIFIQHCTNLTRKFLHRKRFLNGSHLPLLHPMLHHHLIRIPRHIKNPKILTRPPQARMRWARSSAKASTFLESGEASRFFSPLCVLSEKNVKPFYYKERNAQPSAGFEYASSVPERKRTAKCLFR